MHQIKMTQNTYDKIKKQIKELENEIPIVTQAISDARELGDLKENAEYHASRERLGHIEGKISHLSAQLNNAVIINEDNISLDKVGFGVSVRLYNYEFEEEEIVHIVSHGEADPDKDEISVNSPLAIGIMDKKVGETAIIKLPMGEVKYGIKEIFFA
jgi:transcription elongation factor GreA